MILVWGGVIQWVERVHPVSCICICMDEETGRRYSCNEATQYSLVTSTGVHVYVCTLYLYYIYDIHIYLYL